MLGERNETGMRADRDGLALFEELLAADHIPAAVHVQTAVDVAAAFQDLPLLFGHNGESLYNTVVHGIRSFRGEYRRPTARPFIILRYTLYRSAVA